MSFRIKIPREKRKTYCLTVIDEEGKMKSVCGSDIDKVLTVAENLRDVDVYTIETPPQIEEDREDIFLVPKRGEVETRKFVKRVTRKEEGFF